MTAAQGLTETCPGMDVRTAVPLRGRVSYALKCTIAFVLYASGLLDLYKRLVLRKRPVVVTYHRVLSAQSRARTWSHPAIIVQRDTFERHMQLLRERFRLVGIRQFTLELQSGSLRPASCLVTFDDGWQDTWSEAWPVLDRHKIPALVFLPVNYIGSARRFWQEQLARDLFHVWRLAARSDAFGARARAVLGTFGLEPILDAGDAEIRSAIVRAIVARKHAPPEEIRGICVAVSALAGPSDDVDGSEDGFMSWAQVHEMATGGIDFGGHGAEHVILTTVPLDHARREILESERVLRAKLGPHAIAFSYPNGDWTPAIAEAVKEAGYQVAFTTSHPGAAAPYAIRRVNVHEDMTAYLPLFYARVLGVL